MNTTFLSRTTLSALTLLALGTLPLLADHPAKITIEIKTEDGKAPTSDFLNTQSQIIRKNEILSPVIERLGLVEKLGKPREEVARLLNDNLKVQFSRNTSLIEVILDLPDQNLAAATVTAIVNVYKDRRLSDLKHNLDIRLFSMKDELEKEETKTRAAYQAAADLRQRFHILDPDPESINTIVTVKELGSFETTQQAAEELTARVKEQAARCQALAKLKPEEFLDAVGPLKIEDPVITQVLPQLALARAEEAGLLAAGAPEKDPRLSALHAKMEVYTQTLQQRRESILRGNDAVLKVEKELLTAAEEQVTTGREQASSTQASIQKYVEVKSAYLLAKSLLQVIQQRYAAARFDSNLAMEPVKIWELPDTSGK